MLLVATIWASLTLVFIYRLMIILRNLAVIVHIPSGIRGWLRIPKLNLRPLKQMIIWSAELLLLIFFYNSFGMSTLSHFTAALCGFGMMLLLREKQVPILEGLQLIEMKEARSARRSKASA